MAGGAGIRAGRAFVAFSTDNTAFERGLKSMQLRLSGFGAGISSMGSKLMAFTGIAGLIGGALSGFGFIEGIKGALDFGSALTDLQNRTGGSFASLQVLQKAFDITGISADQVGPSINRLQKVLAAPSDKQAAVIKDLGLSFSDLLALDPATQFQTVGAAIASVQDPAARAAAAIALFGKGGGGLLALFRDTDSFALAAKLLGGQVEIFARRAPLFDHLSDVFGSWHDKLRGLWAGVADGLAPVLEMAANWFEGLDLSGFGQRIGNALTDAFTLFKEAFVQGRLGELLSAELTVAFSRLADLFQNLFPLIAQGFIAIFYALGPVLAGVVKTALSTPIKSVADAIMLQAMKDKLAPQVSELERLKGLRGSSTLESEFGVTPAELESRISSLQTEVDVAQGAIRDFNTTATPGEAERRAKEQAELSAGLSGLFGTLRGVVGGVKSGAQVVSDDTQAAIAIRDKLRAEIMAGAAQWQGPELDYLGQMAMQGQEAMIDRMLASVGESGAGGLMGQGYGTFSASAAARFGTGESTTQQIAKNTSETAKNTSEIKDGIDELKDEMGPIG